MFWSMRLHLFSVRPLLFHPWLAILLSLSHTLSRAAAIASSVYSSYCMTYTWRVCSLFIFGTPTAWVQLSTVCITSATVSSLTFSSSCMHRQFTLHSFKPRSLWESREVKRTDKASPGYIAAVHTWFESMQMHFCFVKGKQMLDLPWPVVEPDAFSSLFSSSCLNDGSMWMFDCCDHLVLFNAWNISNTGFKFSVISMWCCY